MRKSLADEDNPTPDDRKAETANSRNPPQPRCFALLQKNSCVRTCYSLTDCLVRASPPSAMAYSNSFDTDATVIIYVCCWSTLAWGCMHILMSTCTHMLRTASSTM